MSPPLSLKSGTFELPTLVFENTPIASNHTAEQTLPQIQSSSSNHAPNSSTVYNQPLSLTRKTPHLPFAAPFNLRVTIDNCSYSILRKKNFNILDPASFDFSILLPTLYPCKNPSQTNTMNDELDRNHPNFKANLPALFMTLTTYKFRFPQDHNCDHFVAYASKNLEQLSFWQQNRIHFFQIQFKI